MAVLSLTDAFCYVGGYDFTTDTNTANLGVDVAVLDATTFNSQGWQENAAGLKSVNFAYSGFWSAAANDQSSDAQSFPMLGTSQPCTFGPVETENQVAYIFNAVKSQYTLGGNVGDLAPFSLTSTGATTDGVVRGRLAAAKQTVSATGALGTGLNLGALSASQYLYATLHVFADAFSAVSLTVAIQSDDNSGFTTPTTVATVTSSGAGGGTWITKVAGPITDTWFRFNVTTIGATLSLAGAIGKA